MTRHWAVGIALLLSLPGHARAQNVNNSALDALTPARPTARPAPAHPAAPHATATARPQASKPAPTAGTATARQAVPVPPKPPPAVPVAPPAIAAIPPAVAVPVGKQPPPTAPPVAADAPGEPSPIPGGVRVTFGPDRTDLNGATERALRDFARTVKGNEQETVNVVATAAGTADDPSTPRRLSLSRALAARAVLVNEGIASTRIYVRALGTNGPEGPADRVDLIASGVAAGAASGSAPGNASGNTPANAPGPPPANTPGTSPGNTP
jgi:outer membrane protein OmpA-like peptidoglycan-associated protein